MKLEEFHACLEDDEARGYDLNDEQKEAVNHTEGPLWIIAGPGSGKSEALVTRALRLVCVDEVHPKSIFLTTFTKKAARSLEDRMSSYLSVLQQADPGLRGIDLAEMRIGTIHSLCNDVLLEFRYPPYQNVRLLDQVDQSLFMYRQAAIANHQDIAFWEHFDYAVSWQWSAGRGYPPNKWQRVRAATTLFNRLVEDLVDVESLRGRGGHWATLATFYDQYQHVLTERYRCDFAHLQARFLQFLREPFSGRFLLGDGEEHPPLHHVLVDEYQDTNPIQERIYLELAQRAPHNLAVVGDDDQALYRFRGGTVSCMVNFDQACEARYGVTPATVQLVSNYRSHEKIVDFFTDYITSFPEMQVDGVRAPDKEEVGAAADIDGDYPAVAWITRKKVRDLWGAIADFIDGHLLGDGVISDPSQCAILMRSTKESARNAGPLVDALKQRGIPVYNPRSKSFTESEEVRCLLAALIRVIDAEGVYEHVRQRGFTDTVYEWQDTLQAIINDEEVPTEELEEYIDRSREEMPNHCAESTRGFLGISLHEIVYRILSREPFVSWQDDPVRNMRLAKVTRLFESYHSLNLDSLRANPNGTAVDEGFLNSFYYTFVTYIMETGIDDEEDEEVVVPRGQLPLMTVHQSKGLEFPIVIVTQLGKKRGPGAAQILENELAPFRDELYERPLRDPGDLAVEDDIRLLYVAYSRAQYALVLIGTKNHIKKHVAAPGRDFTEFRRTVPMLQ